MTVTKVVTTTKEVVSVQVYDYSKGAKDPVKMTVPACVHCRIGSVVIVARASAMRWQRGALVQDAFPSLTADEREHLLNGIHPACWTALFGE